MWQFVIIICTFIFLLVPEKHALHMFQQNRYELTRFTTWLKENKITILKNNIVVLFSFILLLVLSFVLSETLIYILSSICLLLLAFLLIANEKKKSYIKPLVYTGRVKRQIVVLNVLVFILFFVLSRFSTKLLPALLLLIAYYGIWLLIYPMACLTTPIEKAVQNYYINDAKKMLQNP